MFGETIEKFAELLGGDLAPYIFFLLMINVLAIICIIVLYKSNIKNMGKVYEKAIEEIRMAYHDASLVRRYNPPPANTPPPATVGSSRKPKK